MALNQLQYNANSHAVCTGYVLHRALVVLVLCTFNAFNISPVVVHGWGLLLSYKVSVDNYSVSSPAHTAK